MYERRQSFCEFGAERRRSMLVPVVIATLRRATSAEWAWSQGLQSTPMMPGNYPPHLSTLLARWAAARPVNLSGRGRLRAPLVLVTSTRAHSDCNGTARHQRRMGMIPRHVEQAHDVCQQPSAPQLMACVWAAAIPVNLSGRGRLRARSCL